MKQPEVKITVGQGGYLFTAFVVFLALKLTETVAWSWWIITLPLWIVPAIWLVLFVVFMLIGLVGAFFLNKW